MFEKPLPTSCKKIKIVTPEQKHLVQINDTPNNDVQIIQNQSLKLINKLPWRYPTAQLHTDTRYPTLTTFIQNSTLKFESSCAGSEYELIRELTEV